MTVKKTEKKIEKKIEKKLEKKTTAVEIDPNDDGVIVAEGGEAIVQEIGEIDEDLGAYFTTDGRLLQSPGTRGAWAYKVLPADIDPDRRQSEDIAWRREGWERLENAICRGIPGDVYRTSRRNKDKIDARRKARAMSLRDKRPAPEGLSGTTTIGGFDLK